MRQTSGRLLNLLSLLQARRDWPGPALADRLAVSARTVRRDVDRLRELGYPVRALKGPDGGYRLDAGADLPPLLFDDEQAVAIAVALRTAVASGAGIGEAAMRALTTVRQVMPSRLRHRIDALEVTAVGRGDEADSAVLVAIGAAVRAREVLRFDYGDQRRKAEPHHLVARSGRWYLVAWDLDRGDWRTFRADRIRPVTPNGPRFTPREVPGGDVATFVTERFRGELCVGEVFIGRAAAEVAPFAGNAVVEDAGPDRCRAVLSSWSWIGLAASLGRFDAEVEVAGPPELREACATLARRYGRASG
ncbi:WYL domain-containing protein [Actinoplanes sp. NBRC 103695]|uniref:helix-turn-helix transcriptional regulator n=1 Tax=Actinoplanes sp. NBRC 103695 TaxID=3032202 RepID=UPI0024A288DE|nr:WYL domain-containing protein [Actinoplanes sp. NBRC 103695]GLY92867.1 DeoR family transcriptional regulator [Actinoplanes sp. NBRC 103695]